MKKNAGSPTSSSCAGFTLIEVVIAVAILVAVMVPLLGAVSYGLQSVSAMRQRSLVLRLAQDKMTELEMMKFPEAEGTEEGNFGPGYPEIKWKLELVKSPELQLMESQIPALKGMEVHLTVSWTDSGAEKSLELHSLLLE